MSTRIEPLAQERVMERHDHRLATAWVRSARAVPPVPPGHWLMHADDVARHADAHAPSGAVLVMLRSASSPLMAELMGHARAGARVYVLAPSSWAPAEPALQRCPRLLVRRVAEVPVAAVHTTLGATLWLHTSAGDSPWRLRLDEAQAAALRQLFLRSFWHEALDEAWGGGPRLAFRPAAARPFDVPEPPASALLRFIHTGATLGPPGPEQRVHLEGAALPSARVRRLWLTPSGAHHAALARLVREGATVVGGAAGLPDLTTDGRAGVMLLPGPRGRLHVVLSPPQAAELAERLDAPAPWDFRLDVRLGDHASDRAALWLDGAPGARSVALEQVIALPATKAPALRGLPEVSPRQWPAPDPLSLTVRYRWTIEPPRVPATAGEDALVTRWREHDERFVARVDALGSLLAAADEHRGRLARSFERLAGPLMGFGRVYLELQRERSALAEQRPSAAGPERAVELLQRLDALEERTRTLHREQEDTEHHALVDDERERQRAVWEAKVEAARRELPGQRSALQEAESRAAKLATELAEAERAHEAPELGKQGRKDLKARRNKLIDERSRLERRIALVRGELTTLEQRTIEPFTFSPPERPTPALKRPGGRFVPVTSPKATIPVPEAALPEVGALRSLDGQRYLVIEAWGDLELGEAAARRLDARLCTTEDA